MRVKIGDTWYDAKDQPVMIEIDDIQRKQIASMDPEATRYCVYDDAWKEGHTAEEIMNWIRE
jgi:hypothetical protein